MGLYLKPMHKILSSITFRRTLAFAAMFIFSNLLLFAFIYWQTALYETDRITAFLEHQAEVLAQASPDQIRWSVQQRVSSDLHRVTFSALFDKGGRFIEGNLATIPVGLPLDGAAHQIDVVGLTGSDNPSEPVIAVARRLPDLGVLVIGRNIQELAAMREIVARALKLGVIPMAGLAIFVGAILSQRMNRRMKLALQILDQVKEGQLHRRLLVGKSGDEFDLLAKGVNAMLAELERLMHELHHVGNNIAHDLRTPLSRVRAQLERAQRLLADRPDLDELLGRAIAGLDQTFALTTALLRIAEIETGRARASFGVVDLREIMREVVDLYNPLAEAKEITVSLDMEPVSDVKGDRDLLLEALANLLDNAVKFTPGGGRVELSLSGAVKGPTIKVRDSGPGIAAAQREDVFKRFYRGIQNRNIGGNGLGLSLVAAVMKLHGFSIEIKHSSPGCVFELHCFTNAPSSAESEQQSKPGAASSKQPLLKRILGVG
jgi:signal transduction histidine kinase